MKNGKMGKTNMKKAIRLFAGVCVLCLTPLYSVTLEDLISFRDGAFVDNKKFQKISYRFRLVEKITKTSGIFNVLIDIDYKGSTRVIKRSSWDSRGQRYRIVRRFRRPTQRLREESWRDNNLGRIPENNVRRVETIYIEDIDLSDEVVGELVDFKNKTLYRSGVFSRRSSVPSRFGRGRFSSRPVSVSGGEYRKYTFDRKKAELYLIEKNKKEE